MRCISGSDETILHKYVQCSQVSDAWFTLRQLLESLDALILFESDHAILNLCFTNLFREEPIIWLIGEYVALVEYEVVLNNRTLTHNGLIGHLEARRLLCSHMCIPIVGTIPGMDKTGVG